MVNIGRRNGLLLEGIKPFFEAMLTDHQTRPLAFTWPAISWKYTWLAREIYLEITYLKHLLSTATPTRGQYVKMVYPNNEDFRVCNVSGVCVWCYLYRFCALSPLWMASVVMWRQHIHFCDRRRERSWPFLPSVTQEGNTEAFMTEVVESYHYPDFSRQNTLNHAGLDLLGHRNGF